jgi:hypothetical protein
MAKPIEKALIEASNPQTDPERLQVLSEWERKDERPRIRQAIAANPNSDERLLLGLAAEYPNEVMANPRFQLLLMSAKSWWKDAEPLSLLRLLAALGPTAPSQARLDFFDELGGLLARTDPLEMNMEQHMRFSQEITIEWQDSSGEEDEAESGERVPGEDVGPNHNDVKQQDVSIDFSCIAEDGLWILCPPDNIDDPLGVLEELINCNTSEEILNTLMNHGWKEQSSSLGDYGYWEIKCISPQLDGWQVDADLSIDGSGTIQIENPEGETHVVDVEAPDKEYEFLNPTLKKHPDMVGSILETDLLSSAELTMLLQQVITIEKQSCGGEADPVQAQ